MEKFDERKKSFEKKFAHDEEELKMRSISRKSLHYSKNFSKHHILCKDDFELLRPGTGIYYSEVDNIIGKKLQKDVMKGQIISMNDFDDFA